jgi:hypothetical protein
LEQKELSEEKGAEKEYSVKKIGCYEKGTI